MKNLIEELEALGEGTMKGKRLSGDLGKWLDDNDIGAKKPSADWMRFDKMGSKLKSDLKRTLKGAISADERQSMRDVGTYALAMSQILNELGEEAVTAERAHMKAHGIGKA
jgi:hypothetical protein